MNLFVNKKKGFTLIEMMVVLVIFSIITGIVIVNVPSLRNRVSVDLVAQSIALNIRQAQSFGIATRQIDNVTPTSWGVHFNRDVVSQFLLFFVHSGQPKIYQSDNFDCESNNCFEIYNIRGAMIDDLCVSYGVSNNCVPVNMVDIAFTRPSSEPIFCVRGNYSAGCHPQSNQVSYFSFRVVSSTNQEFRNVTVFSSGQVAVDF